MLKRIAAAVAVLGAVALFRPAPAEAHFSFSVVLPGLAVFGGPPCPLPPPVVYAPPVYYAPPAPVVFIPRPYYPGPVVYGAYRGGYRGGRGWSRHGRRW